MQRSRIFNLLDSPKSSHGAGAIQNTVTHQDSRWMLSHAKTTSSHVCVFVCVWDTHLPATKEAGSPFGGDRCWFGDVELAKGRLWPARDPVNAALPRRNWVYCQRERVSATFWAQSIILSHWANELHCEICCVFPWHQPLGCGIHHAQPVGILDPQRHLRLSARHSTLSAAVNKYWRDNTLFELM